MRDILWVTISPLNKKFKIILNDKRFCFSFPGHYRDLSWISERIRRLWFKSSLPKLKAILSFELA